MYQVRCSHLSEFKDQCAFKTSKNRSFNNNRYPNVTYYLLLHNKFQLVRRKQYNMGLLSERENPHVDKINRQTDNKMQERVQLS